MTAGPRGVLVAALALSTMALTACQVGGGDTDAGPQTIDTHQLEHDLRTWAVKQGAEEIGLKVQCPGDIEIKVGREFHCIVSASDDESVRITVTIENSKGYITWVAG